MINNNVDFDLLYELSGGDKSFINDVLQIFLDNTQPGLMQLKALVDSQSSYDDIRKQAHYLKSSVGIVKINGMQSQLVALEQMAKNELPLSEIGHNVQEIINNFMQAKPFILIEMKKIESLA